MNRRSKNIFLIALLIALIFFPLYTLYRGLSSTAHSNVEDCIVKRMPSILGAAQSYHSKVFGNPSQMLRGELPRVDIDAEKLILKNGIKLEKLTISLNDIKANTRKMKITNIGKANFKATINQSELNSYIKQRYPDIDGLNVSLAEGIIHLGAITEIRGFKTNINADARLNVQNNTLIILDLKNLTASGIDLPGFTRNQLESKFNPLADTSKLKSGLEIESIVINPGELTLTGKLGNLDISKL